MVRGEAERGGWWGRIREALRRMRSRGSVEGPIDIMRPADHTYDPSRQLPPPEKKL